MVVFWFIVLKLVEVVGFLLVSYGCYHLGRWALLGFDKLDEVDEVDEDEPPWFLDLMLGYAILMIMVCIVFALYAIVMQNIEWARTITGGLK